MNALSCPYTAHSQASCPLPEFSPETLDQFDQQMWHSLYDCPLHTWLSQAKAVTGKNTTSDIYILYVEYRDRYRASQYEEYHFHSLECALAFRSTELVTTELNSINPEMTRRYPIKP